MNVKECYNKIREIEGFVKDLEQKERKRRHKQIRATESLPVLAEGNHADTNLTSNGQLTVYAYRKLQNDVLERSVELKKVQNLDPSGEALKKSVDEVNCRLQKLALVIDKQPPAVVKKSVPFHCGLRVISNPSLMDWQDIAAQTQFYILTERQAREFSQLTDEIKTTSFLQKLDQVGKFERVVKSETTHARRPKVAVPGGTCTMDLLTTDSGFSYYAQMLEMKLVSIGDAERKEASSRRPQGNQPPSRAAALRYYLLFERSFSLAAHPGAAATANDKPERVSQRVLSFPFNISVQTSQYEAAAIESFWFRSFCIADKNGNYFDFPHEASVSELLTACARFFARLTSSKRVFSQSDLVHMEKKLSALALKVSRNDKISFHAFAQLQTVVSEKGGSWSLASWFYQTAFLIFKYCADFWNDGIIFGFIARNDRFNELRKCVGNKSYMLALSDTTPGIAICYISGDDHIPFDPCGKDELEANSLLQRIRNNIDLRGLKLHPQTAQASLDLKMNGDAANRDRFYWTMHTSFSHTLPEKKGPIGYKTLTQMQISSTSVAASFMPPNSSTLSPGGWQNDASSGSRSGYDSVSPAQNTHSYDDEMTCEETFICDRTNISANYADFGFQGSQPRDPNWSMPDAVSNGLVTPPPPFVNMHQQQRQHASLAFGATGSSSYAAQSDQSFEEPDV